MTIRQILERRSAIRVEMQQIHAANPDALPDGPAQRWAVLEAEANTLAAQEQRQAAIDDLDRRAAGHTVSGVGDDRFDSQAAQVSVLDVIQAQMGSTSVAAGRAREVSAELARRSGRNPEGLYFHMGAGGTERRDLTTFAPATGSNLVQTTVSPNIIDRLRERVLVRKMGATVLGGLTGNLSIPRLKQSAVAQWVAENSPITETDPVYDQVPLTPKHCGGIVQISRQMLQQSSPDVATLVENDLVQILAVALDQAAIIGGGPNQPSGILATGSGVSVLPGGTNGAAPSWNNIMNLIAAVDQSNALDGSLGFVTNAKVVRALRSTPKTAADTASNFIEADPTMLAGYGLGSTQNVPSNLSKGSGTNLSALIFGDWSQMILGFWSELDILANPYGDAAYSRGAVAVRAMTTADVRLRQPLAFAAITDLIA